MHTSPSFMYIDSYKQTHAKSQRGKEALTLSFLGLEVVGSNSLSVVCLFGFVLVSVP